jgi:hypothetical protein
MFFAKKPTWADSGAKNFVLAASFAGLAGKNFATLSPGQARHEDRLPTHPIERVYDLRVVRAPQV